MLAFDIESDGLLDDITTIHCLHIRDRVTKKDYRFNSGKYKDGSPAPRDGSIKDGLKMLEEADAICGHNIIGYDIEAIKKLNPTFKPKGKVVDTLVCCRVVWTDISDKDFARLRSGKLPPEFKEGGLIGSHSLEAWGYRLGKYKGDFKPEHYINEETGEPHTWKTIGFTQDMDDYCGQDVYVTDQLIDMIDSKQYSQDSLDLEHHVATIIRRQELYGFAFDEVAAMKLLATLQKRKAELEFSLIESFHPWYAPDGTRKGVRESGKSRNVWIEHDDGKAPLKKHKTRQRGWLIEYTQGTQHTAIKLVQFNPSSRDHIADRLITLYGWNPVEFTDGGKPKVDETTLVGLSFPEAKLLNEYLMVDKRIGQLSDGKQAWLKKVRNGRIHGRVNTNGAVTGRMTHSDPNLAQVPKCGSPYGAESRALFIHSKGCLVGCDAEGLELRMLAHYMAKYDGGEYVNAVVNGKKEDKTDVHSVNQAVVSFNKRDNAKTLVYAFLYGAGDYKLGTIVLDDMTEQRKAAFFAKYPAGASRDAAIGRLGKSVKAKFFSGLPALKKLVDAVKDAVKKRGRVKSLDGRYLSIRSPHAALNTLLQGGGAIVMKKALVMLDDNLQQLGYREAGRYEFVCNVHDEFQIDSEESIAKEIGSLAASAIRRAGEHFGLKCPLAGAYEIGSNWAETH